MCMTNRTSKMNIYSSRTNTCDIELLCTCFSSTIWTYIIDYDRFENVFKKNIWHIFNNYELITFCIRLMLSSFQRIYASSNAPGENSSPERATRSGQRICQFFCPDSAIAARIGDLMESRLE